MIDKNIEKQKVREALSKFEDGTSFPQAHVPMTPATPASIEPEVVNIPAPESYRKRKIEPKAVSKEEAERIVRQQLLDTHNPEIIRKVYEEDERKRKAREELIEKEPWRMTDDERRQRQAREVHRRAPGRVLPDGCNPAAASDDGNTFGVSRRFRRWIGLEE
jgi:hypothetical protein